MTIPLGVWLLEHVDGSFYALGLGVFLTAYGSYAVMRRENRAVRGNAWLDAAAGALGGITGGLAGFPGLVRDDLVLDARLGQAPAASSLPALHSGHAGRDHRLPAVAGTRPRGRRARPESSCPFALLGAIGGLALFQRMSNKQFHVAVSLLLVASGIGLLSPGRYENHHQPITPQWCGDAADFGAARD